MTTPKHPRTVAAERLSGQLLIGLTYVAVGFLVVGVLAMAANGISPLSGGPLPDLPDLAAQVIALDPAAVLWVGLSAVIAAPLARVVVAGIAYATEADWRMVAVSIAILAIIALGVGTALTATV